jgi:signal peptidase I
VPALLDVSTLAVTSVAATHPTVLDRVLEALVSGPLTAHQIVAAVSSAWPGMFRAREGLVFPLLLQLRRNGLVRVEWTDAAGGRRLLHSLADAPAADPAPRVPEAPTVPAWRKLEEAADRATKGLAFAPRLREEFRHEVLFYLRDSVAERLACGESPESAEKESIRALGDPWKIGTDLARTAEGKRTVVFATGTADSLTGMAIYDLRVLLVIVAVIVFVRVQVVTAYHIPTKSMEPTLHGDPRHGDRILVNKLSGTPERFDITVFDGFGTDRKNFVKRCVGLPNEKLDLHEGDLWIDGHLVRKEGAAFEALLFEVFDRGSESSRIAAKTGATSGEAFEPALRARMQELWRFEGEGECGVQQDEAAPFAGFRLAAPSGPESASPPQIAWHEIVEDTYIDPETGERRSGTWSVADLRLTVSVKPVPDTDARVVLRLTRGEEHTYDAVIRGDGKGVRLVADGEEVARSDDVSIEDGVATTVSFSQVDRVLRLTVGGKPVLRHDLPEPEDPKRYGPAAAAMVRVTRGAAWIDPVRLERDVYYVPEGPDENFVRLGPDQFFMMGDNSSNSSDSRVHGPVHRGRLIGKPLLVVWPPSRIHVPD